MTDPLLGFEIRLLLVRHGKRQVLEALASLDGCSIEALESDLTKLEERKQNKIRRKKTPEEIIAAACANCPENKTQISLLIGRYIQRQFLPHLREVERFLDRAGAHHGKLKSRQAALPNVAYALASFSSAKLQSLAEQESNSKDNAFSLLANEIMRTRDKQ